MDSTVSPLLLATAVAAGALGVYLLLPKEHASPRRAVRVSGGALAGLSLLFLWVFFGRPAEGWPPPGRASSLTHFVFLLLAAGSLVAAVAVITSRRPRESVCWLAVMAAFNGGLCVLQAAEYVGLAAFGIGAGAAALVWLSIFPSLSGAQVRRDPLATREPLLACLAGAVLAVVLIGTARYALAVEAQRQSPSMRLSALPRPLLVNSMSQYAGRENRGEPPADAGITGLRTALLHEHAVAVGLAVVLIVTVIAGGVLIVQRSRDPDSSAQTDRTNSSIKA